jgi:hypothetical protein
MPGLWKVTLCEMADSELKMTTAAEIINRIHEQLDNWKLLSVYGQTVEFVSNGQAFRVWCNVADELETRSIDPKYNYQVGEETKQSRFIKEKLTK